MSEKHKEFILARNEKFIQIVDDKEGITALTSEGRIAWKPHYGGNSKKWWVVKMPRSLGGSN